MLFCPTQGHQEYLALKEDFILSFNQRTLMTMITQLYVKLPNLNIILVYFGV